MDEIQSLSLTDIIPARTDRVLAVGQTGSGKTTLMRYLLQHRKHVIALDYKGRLDWGDYTIKTRLSDLVRCKDERLLYRPTFAESVDQETCAKLWEFLYRRGNTTIYVDETAAITKGDIYPFYYGAVLMRGRELGLELWSATQRPKNIPQIVLSESENVFAFQLRLPQDRQRVESLTGISADDIASLPKKYFLYAPQEGEVVGPLTLQIAA